jgi:hypothetical protein
VHMNGGKTESTIKHLSHYSSVLIILSRESLVKSFYTRLDEKYPNKYVCYDATLSANLKKYKTKRKKDAFIESINYDFYVTTLNSLYKIKKKKYDCIVIDEYELLLNSFNPSSSLISTDSCKKLVGYLNTANKLILLDALPSQKGVRFLKSIGVIQNITDVCVIGSSIKPPPVKITKITSKVKKIRNFIKILSQKDHQRCKGLETSIPILAEEN